MTGQLILANQNTVNKKEVQLSIVGPQAFHVEYSC